MIPNPQFNHRLKDGFITAAKNFVQKTKQSGFSSDWVFPKSGEEKKNETQRSVQSGCQSSGSSDFQDVKVSG